MWQYRPLTWILLFVFGILLQTSLLPQIFPIGYVPNVVLSVTVLVALYETPGRGLAAGFIGGMMQDIWAGRMIGLDALTFALLGWAIGYLQTKIARDPVFVPGLVAGLSQVVVVPFQWVLLIVAGYHLPWLTFVKPLPVWILFSMFFTPGLGGVLGFRSRRELDSRRAMGM